MTDVTRFLNSLEQYIDARIVLNKTDMSPVSRRSVEAAEFVQEKVDFTRADLVDELKELFK